MRPNTAPPIIPDAKSGRTHAAHVADAMEAKEPACAESVADEIRTLAGMADAWRKARGMTDEQFVAQFGNVCGDRKTFAQFARQDPSKWDRRPENWLKEYRLLQRSLADFDEASATPPLLELPQTAIFASAVKELRRRMDEKRVLWVEGIRGSGKSSLLRSLRATLGESRCILIRGRQSWASFGIMLQHWLEALGQEVKETRRPESAARLQERVARALREAGDIVVAVDEAHCIPSGGLNFLRDIANDAHEASTRVHFVGAAIPSKWDDLTARYKEEAAQLVRRFSDRISLDSPDAEECLMLLSQRVDLAALEGKARDAGALLAQKAAGHGSRSYVADVAAAAARAGAKLSWPLFQEIAASAAKKNRIAH